MKAAEILSRGFISSAPLLNGLLRIFTKTNKFKTNHIATEILTRGFISSFKLMNGILANLRYVIVTKNGNHGGISYSSLKEDFRRIPINDIDSIKVYVDWFKKPNRDKSITVELLENKIHADIIHEFGNLASSVKISVIKLD